MMEKGCHEYFLPPSKQQKDPDTSSIQRPPITRYGADIPKEVPDNIPAFEGKQGELSQFLNTIESYSMMYRVCKTDLVLLHSREKAHKIISHAIAEDPDVEWSDIKRNTQATMDPQEAGSRQV